MILRSVLENEIKFGDDKKGKIYWNLEAVKDEKYVVTYELRPGFEDIVSCFTTSGITSDKLLKYLDVSSMK